MRSINSRGLSEAGGCYEGCSEVFDRVVVVESRVRKRGLGGSSPQVSDKVLDRALRVVERAVLLKRRIEQKIMKAANVSLLALCKERKERP